MARRFILTANSFLIAAASPLFPQTVSVYPDYRPTISRGSCSSRRVPNSATCIHLAEESDGTLVAWQDSKSPRVINAPMQNEYGREFNVQDAKLDSISLIAASSKWFGNQVTFSGTLSTDGSQLEGRWATNGQPGPKSLIFIKSSGEGFSAALSSP